MSVLRVNTKGMRVFTWRGEPIADIETWAQSRGEQMVRYRYTRRYYEPMYQREVEEYYDDAMPASFFGNLRYGTGEHYLELERYAPTTPAQE